MNGVSLFAKALLSLVLTCSIWSLADAWVAPNVVSVSTTPFSKGSVIVMRARGKGSLGKEFGGERTGIESSSKSSVNWIPLSVAASTLPSVDDKVQLIDTNLFTLKNAQTNPTGAVSVLKHGDKTYCFSVNCPSCKIPLTKAKVLPSSNNRSAPRLLCDFCKAEFDLSTGEALESTTDTGLLGGIAKKIFAAQDHGPLKLYKLGEKGGKLLIALD